MMETPASLRVDVWLFRTRLFKSRRLAAELVTSGKLRLARDGQTHRVGRSSFQVRAGDVLIYIHGNDLLHVTILDCPERRGPASEAQGHYSIDRRALDTPPGKRN